MVLFVSFFLVSQLVLFAHSQEFMDVVFGGLQAKEGQFPYLVSIQYPKGRHSCGGSIYNSRWIVTAAHCIKPKMDSRAQIVVGMTQLELGTPYGITFAMAYPGNDWRFLYDLGLIKTSDDIRFNDHVKPIPLNPNVIGEGLEADIGGWGRTEKGRTKNLMYTTMETISNDVCRVKMQGKGGERLLPTHLCTISPYEVGTCFGDSGGPLTFNGTLIGIVSFGVPCGLEYPDVFTRISSYKGWIEDQTRNN